jgi:cation-transporting ATPase E
MVPQGLVLLTSIAFAVSVIELGRRNVLVQELAAVEVLARVDTVCVDKTGTLTEASLEVRELVPLAEDPAAAEALGALAALAPNATAKAIAASYPAPAGWQADGVVAFSSARKWSGADFGGRGRWVLGAPEVLLAGGGHPEAAERAAAIAASGVRVVLLARAGEPLSPAAPPASLEPAALVVLAERIRPDAADTLRYFAEQGVAVKVISGDDPRTVSAIAAAVGLDPGEPLDARTLPEDEAALAEAMDTHTVFGRVTPEQKRRMVAGLRSRGHVVAMTGDGVNDVLALKAADLGIAMGSGAPATRAIAQVVLLDGRFATLPRVVAEGRRVIANIERVANLFLTKTVYAILIALGVAALAVPFPYLPRHLTVVSSLTIGIPGFFLALEPNPTRYRPGFLGRVLRFVGPAGVACAVAALAAYLAAGPSQPDSRTEATIALTLMGLWVLGTLAQPLRPRRLALVLALAAGLALVLALPFARWFFALAVPPAGTLVLTLATTAAGVALLEGGLRLTRWRRIRAESR